MSALQLRPYQTDSIDALRDGVRKGHRRQILAAPTGSGKTVVSTFLMEEVAAKMSRAAFICDRVALVDQTSATFDQYRIAHGVMQAQHWRTRPWERIQVASAQTLARRGFKDDLQLIVWDECHTLYRSIAKFVTDNPDLIVVGLTATPFTKGLGQIFTNVVNVTTTDRLVGEKWLVPIKAFAARPVNMKGAKLKFDGEWDDKEIETRAMTIVGDVVTEWRAKTNQFFGGPAKTIVFSASVAHGEELCKQFQAAGHNFQQVSYLDGNDDRRRALIEEFRKPDSEIVGLVSCEALAKGFDVPDIMVGISCRPYRKSLSGHVQQLGRVMRPFPGKEFALWLDHSGNFIRFLDDQAEVFANGVSTLDDGSLDAKVRKDVEEEDADDFKCGQCQTIMPPKATHCPLCGWERPRRQSLVQNVPGEMVEVGKGKVKATPGWMQDKQQVWREIVGLALEMKQGDVVPAEKFALAQYRNLYDAWPRYAMRNIEPAPPSLEVRNQVKHQLIRWRYRTKRAA